MLSDPVIFKRQTLKRLRNVGVVVHACDSRLWAEVEGPRVRGQRAVTACQREAMLMRGQPRCWGAPQTPPLLSQALRQAGRADAASLLRQREQTFLSPLQE